MFLLGVCQRLVREGRAVPVVGTEAVEVLLPDEDPTALDAKWEKLQAEYAEHFNWLRKESRRKEREAEIKQHRDRGHFVFDCRR